MIEHEARFCDKRLYTTEQQFQDELRAARIALLEAAGVTEPQHYDGMSNAALIATLIDATGGEVARRTSEWFSFAYPAVLLGAVLSPEAAQFVGQMLRPSLERAVVEGRISDGSYLPSNAVAGERANWASRVAPADQIAEPRLPSR